MTDRGSIPEAGRQDDVSGVVLVETHAGSRKVLRSWHSRLQRNLQMVATVLGILGTLGTGAWWVAERLVVTRAEWAAGQATTVEALRDIAERLARMEARR